MVLIPIGNKKYSGADKYSENTSEQKNTPERLEERVHERGVLSARRLGDHRGGGLKIIIYVRHHHTR